jgi:hypothetical protein
MIVPVVQEVDDDGIVIQELVQENPTAVFGIGGLRTYADNFENELASGALIPVQSNGRAQQPQPIVKP